MIKLFATDVDGVLTDGGMYYTESGDEFKKFNTRDGMGIKLLRQKGIKIAFITSEDTQIVANRAEKLKIDFLCQNVQNKLEIIQKICAELQISLAEVAYIGDDVNDYEILSAVGRRACPNDAVEKIKNIKDIIVLDKNGGAGAVRELCDIILKELVS